MTLLRKINNMKLFVHKIIWIDVKNQGHWYDNDYTYDLLVQYSLYSNKVYSNHIINNNIEELLSEASKAEIERYNHFYNGEYINDYPKLYYSLDDNHSFLYKAEEIDNSLSEKICIMLKTYNIVASVFLLVPHELDFRCGRGTYPPKEFGVKYCPQNSECSNSLLRKFYHYSDI